MERGEKVRDQVVVGYATGGLQRANAYLVSRGAKRASTARMPAKEQGHTWRNMIATVMIKEQKHTWRDNDVGADDHDEKS